MPTLLPPARLVPWLGLVATLAGLVPAVRAQWTVVYLQPGGGAGASLANGARGGQQVGQVEFPAINDSWACLWNGSAASPVYLNPPGTSFSRCFGMDATQQVGHAYIGPGYHASLWTGSATSWVDLNPPGAIDSRCFAVDGGQQVGEVGTNGGYTPHASLWSGSASSWVDLNPAGAIQSQAFAVAGGRQVGTAYFAALGGHRAGYWTGSAASWVDLTPLGYSGFAHGADAVQQVGEVFGHARLWTGTVASMVDLHPVSSGANYSVAFAVHGGQQVGMATLFGVDSASLWSGTGASWVNLHAFLPAHFSRSRALSIWHEGGVTYVAGYGYNYTLQRHEALLWVHTGPTHYGTGCPGTGALVPAIGSVGLPTLGNASFGVRVTQGLPNSICALAAGVAATSIPIGSCTILVAEPSVNFVGPTDSTGAFHFGLPIPSIVGLVGAEFFWQGLVLDPAGALLGFASMSDGLMTRIGF